MRDAQDRHGGVACMPGATVSGAVCVAWRARSCVVSARERENDHEEEKRNNDTNMINTELLDQEGQEVGKGFVWHYWDLFCCP